MNIHDLKTSISDMSDASILEAIKLLRHSRTTEDVVRVVKVKAAKKKEDDMVTKLMALAGGKDALERLLADL